MTTYKAQSARDAQSAGESESYCAYLEAHAQECADYYVRHDDPQTAELMFKQTLGESLKGNDSL